MCGIITQCLSSFLIVCHYQWNKKIIATRLCENKDKPKSSCHGKCHLRKQLKAQEKREQIPASPLKEKAETNQFFEAVSLDLPENLFTNHSKEEFSEPFFYLLQVSLPIFHPPC